MGWAGLAPGPQVIGIVNVTPDSFSDGAAIAWQAIRLAEQMLADGAAVVDIGGESTRPGALPVSPEEEQSRVMPVIEALARRGACLSVDTRHHATMERALGAGAAIVNDVSGLSFDSRASAVVAAWGCPVILMHMRGTPETMNGLATYSDVTADVMVELSARVEMAVAAGVAREQIAIDPGFGFAKNVEQNVALLQHLSHFLNLGCPIIAGLSRKIFVGAMAEIVAPADRDAASIAAGLYAVGQGASVLRVHDVRSTVQALRVWTRLAESTRRG